MRARVRWWVGAVAIALTGQGCSSAAKLGSEGTSCLLTTDCIPGLACVRGANGGAKHCSADLSSEVSTAGLGDAAASSGIGAPQTDGAAISYDAAPVPSDASGSGDAGPIGADASPLASDADSAQADAP